MAATTPALKHKDDIRQQIEKLLKERARRKPVKLENVSVHTVPIEESHH